MPQTKTLSRTRWPTPSGVLTQIRTTLAVVLARRRQRAALSRLDQHMLRDIGLDQTHVAEECTKPAWRD